VGECDYSLGDRLILLTAEDEGINHARLPAVPEQPTLHAHLADRDQTKELHRQGAGD
jgi:hypothetical protein